MMIQNNFTPTVLNKKTDTIPPDAVYVGRPSEWGNPFSHIDSSDSDVVYVDTREIAIYAYELHLLQSIERDPTILSRLRNTLFDRDLVCWCSPKLCHADILLKYANTQEFYTWSNKDGYDVTSKGDKRFSALYATMGDGRTIEEHYQCDVKGYDIGGTNWVLGKDKPAKNPNTNLWLEYFELWKTWMFDNKPVMLDLHHTLLDSGESVLYDRYDVGGVNQARALAWLLNMYYV